MHPDSLVLESLLDPSPNLPNLLNPNHVLNTLISPQLHSVWMGQQKETHVDGVGIFI